MSQNDAAMPENDTTEAPDDATSPEPQESDLGDGGKKALAAERTARRKAEQERAALTAELEKLREANQSEHEKALAKARKEGQQEAESTWKTKWREERLRSEALRLMNGRVSDPRLAFPHLDFEDDVLDEDGTVNTKALKGSIDALLQEYPALAVAESPTHHGDIGAKQTAQAPADMNSLLRAAAGR